MDGRSAEQPSAGKNLCGCWNSENGHPGLDLREDSMHGWPGHERHTITYHGWCYLCCPNSRKARPDGMRTT